MIMTTFGLSSFTSFETWSLLHAQRSPFSNFQLSRAFECHERSLDVIQLSLREILWHTSEYP